MVQPVDSLSTFFSLPMDAQGPQNDQVVGQDEFGRLIYQGQNGSRYVMTERPRMDMSNALAYAVDNPWETAKGVAGAIVEGAWNGIEAPGNALRGETLTYGDVADTAMDWGVFSAAGTAPRGAIRSGFSGDDYRGVHRAPGWSEDGSTASLDNLTAIYPDDIYDTRVAPRYYGHMEDPAADREMIEMFARLRGRPDVGVPVYRAVPVDAPDGLNPGDWVTPSRRYAEGHGQSALGGEYRIIEGNVPARELYTDANSIFEFGWSPRQAAETPARRIARLLREDPSQITDDMLGALTPNDNMELARLYDEGATGMPMPMDEASRMSRAGEHWPGEAYHSTRADFPAFDRGDVGFHVGTDEQAWQRMVQTRRENGMEGEAILPLRVRASNGLTTPDAGEWNDARFAADAMQRGGLQVQDIADEAAEIAPQFDDVDFWKWSDDNQGLLDDLRMEAEAQGYDHIRYANEAENAYGDMPGLTREGKALGQQLIQERAELQRAIAGRRPPPPDDPSQIDAWLNAPAPSPTPEEARRLDAIGAELDRINIEMVNDPYSRVIFDPTNIRSRFARFDPRLRHLANLSAGVAAGGMMLPFVSEEDNALSRLEAYLNQ